MSTTEEILARVTVLAEAPCENYSRGTCAGDTGRTPDAPYTADSYCHPCRLRYALTGASIPAVAPDRAHTGHEALRWQRVRDVVADATAGRTTPATALAFINELATRTLATRSLTTH